MFPASEGRTMSDKPVFLTEDGEVIDFDADTYFVFIDETGGHKLKDPRYPIFGLGGCGVYGPQYGDELMDPWNRLKDNEFDGHLSVLHACDLRDTTETQLEALGGFFRKQQIARLAYLISDQTWLSASLEGKKYHIVARLLLSGISKVVQFYRCKRICIIFESSNEGDRLAPLYFPRYKFVRTVGDEAYNLPVKFGRMPKDDAEPGLEVADFIMHAAGTQTRERLRQESNHVPRKDFEAVFASVDKRLTGFIELTKVDVNL